MTETTPQFSMVLSCHSARDVMSPNPISLPALSTLKPAAAFLSDYHYSAAPVIDEAGKAVGVISATDIVRFVKKQHAPSLLRSDLDDPTWFDLLSNALFDGGDTEVRHVMTPIVFSVTPETPIPQVVEAMLSADVHRLFVVDHSGLLVGVISTFDILKKLKK